MADPVARIDGAPVRLIRKEMSMKTYVNKTILRSIPLNGNLKRYFSARYRWLCRNNGFAFADDYFKQTRQALMDLIASSDHTVEAIREAVRKSPLRYNSMAVRLFEVGLARPHIVLNFLKLYTGNLVNKPDQYKAYADLKEELDDQPSVHLWPSIEGVPYYVRSWVELLLSYQQWRADPNRSLVVLYQWCKDTGDRMANSHSFETWNKYWRTWSYQLTYNQEDIGKIIHAVDTLLEDSEVFPELYKDSTFARNPRWGEHLNVSSSTSGRHDRDFHDWQTIIQSGIRTVNGRRRLNAFGFPKLEFPRTPIPPAGTIDLVKKTGTNDFRPVAAPNRFIQETTKPAYQMLEAVVRKFNMDATWNQDRFDDELVSWVTDDTLSPSGVDLHHATNGLPLAIGDYLVKRLLLPQMRLSARMVRTKKYTTTAFQGEGGIWLRSELYDDFPSLVSASWENFVTASQAAWDSPVGDLFFRKGQPLGLLPSFRTLSLTHHLLVEAMCYEMGYRDSPYRILGDDIVIKYSKVARRYREVMHELGVQISEHKSYKGRLVEFAGKIFIKNQLPFHTPDHNVVQATNAVDFGHVARFPLRWRYLSHKTRKDIQSRVKRSWNEVSDHALNRGWEKVYNDWTLIRELGPSPTNKEIARAYDVISCVHSGNEYYITRVGEEVYSNLEGLMYFNDVGDSPLPYFDNGMRRVDNKYVVSYEKNYRYYDRKSQRYQRHLAVKLPDWYRKKFRPVSTDKLVAYGIVSMRTNSDDIQDAIRRKAFRNHLKG